MSLLAGLEQRASRLQKETLALYLALRHPRTPWYVKILLGSIVAYVFSPIDLIPDFIPVLGYLDDLILVPLGITLAIKLIPETVLTECRSQAYKTIPGSYPESWTAAIVIGIIWLVLAVAFILWIYDTLMRWT